MQILSEDYPVIKMYTSVIAILSFIHPIYEWGKLD